MRATISPMPVTVTDQDVNRQEPAEEKEDCKDVEFGVQAELESCCGILELGKAGGYDGNGDCLPITPKFKEAFRSALLDATSTTHQGLAIYSLADGQVTEAEVLKEEGFLVMSVFRNPNTNNRITLYGKLLNQPRVKPVNKKPAKRKARR